MSSQAKLPGTLPTPAQARAALRLARDAFAARTGAARGLKEQVKLCKDTIIKTDDALEEAERDLLGTDPETGEGLAADVAHGKAMAAIERAETDLEKAKASLMVATDDLAAARRTLTGARGDLRAIRDGRRKR
jgi:hypothetical protein